LILSERGQAEEKGEQNAEWVKPCASKTWIRRLYPAFRSIWMIRNKNVALIGPVGLDYFIH